VTADEKLLKCRGGIGTIILYADRMIIDESSWRIITSHELPIKRIKSVIVERKSVIPFATITVLAAIATVIVKYNALWFLVNLESQTTAWMSMAALAICVVLAIPTLLRAIFVNVAVTWDGKPSSFRVRFVPIHMGRRLARRFREVSAGS
jgi:hypothetical protein